jgi:hypothetical protein
MEVLKQYVGAHYGNDGAADKVPINELRLGVDIYQRQLAARNPRVLIVTNKPHLRPSAYEFETATNHLLQQINLGWSLREAVKSALFMMGVVKVGVSPTSSNQEQGFLHDPGQAYADPVLFDDWLHDMSARRIEEWDWCGNRYRVAYQDVMDSPLFENKDSIPTPNDSTIMGEDPRSHSLSQGGGPLKEEYRDHIELWDLWLPKERLLITIPADGEGMPLRVVEWEGPERGPFHLLSFASVPGNVMPAPPVMQWLDLHDLINRLFVKLGRQAERQKTITLVSGHSAASGTGNRIMSAEDGQVISTDDPQGAQEITYGGIHQGNMAFTMILKDLFSYFGGNLDSLGGLGAQAQTVGQERLLKSSSSQLIEDMQDRVVEFTKGVVSDLAWYQYTNPVLEQQLTLQVPGYDRDIPFTWGPEQRQADFFDYSFNVEPYSMQSRGPGERLQTIMGLVSQLLVPMMPMMQQQGLTVDFEELIGTISKYSDLPELAAIVKSNGVPSVPPVQAEQEVRQSPVTTRNYTRTNIPTGGTQQSRDAMMAKALMGASDANGAQMASMMRPSA